VVRVPGGHWVRHVSVCLRRQPIQRPRRLLLQCRSRGRLLRLQLERHPAKQRSRAMRDGDLHCTQARRRAGMHTHNRTQASALRRPVGHAGGAHAVARSIASRLSRPLARECDMSSYLSMSKCAVGLSERLPRPLARECDMLPYLSMSKCAVGLSGCRVHWPASVPCLRICLCPSVQSVRLSDCSSGRPRVCHVVDRQIRPAAEDDLP
jgi:hypothetical protein